MRRISSTGPAARKAFASAGILLLALVGCSDTDASGQADRASYVEAFVDAAQSENGSTSREQDRCFAESAVDAVGVTSLRDADVSPDDVRESDGSSPADLGVEVSDDDGADYYERLQSCLDVRTYLVDLVVGSGVVTDESVTCVEDAFDDELVRRIVITDFVEGNQAGMSEVADDLEAIYVSCAPGSPASASSPLP
jgi:hypothetical protein